MAGLLRRAIRKYILSKWGRATVQSHLEGDITVIGGKSLATTLDSFIEKLQAMVAEVAPQDTFQLLTKSEGAQSYLVRFTTSSLNTAFKGVQSTALHEERLQARIKQATENGLQATPLASPLPAEDIQRAEVQTGQAEATESQPEATEAIPATLLAEVPSLALSPAEMLRQEKSKRQSRRQSRKQSKRGSK